MMHRFVALLALCVLVIPAFFAPASGQPDAFSLAPLIKDNMVLQQESKVPLWGRGTPGTLVVIRASWGETGESLIQPDGRWMVTLQTPSAGGPYTLEIKHGNTATMVTNVLTGEVWLCSGQSNMQMPMSGWPPGDTVESASQEIRGAVYPEIRLCTVRRTYSAVPEFGGDASWVECTSATVGDFSATAFFFGKELHKALNVPVGLIHSSWGGTPVEAWTSARSLSRVPEFSKALSILPECAEARRQTEKWLRMFPALDLKGRTGENKWRDLRCDDSACAARSYEDTAWKTMRLPALWETTEMGNFDGVVWFRKTIAVPPGWAGKNLVLELGPIDDMDITFVNGVRVGGYEGVGYYNAKRFYPVPGGIVDSTEMNIAVRVVDNQGGGGIYGEPKSMLLRPELPGDTLSLAGDWKYVPVAELMGDSLFVFGPLGNRYEGRPRSPLDISEDTPTALYNGMISPLVPFAIRGAIWYQGEDNAGHGQQYKTLFPLMIEDWRTDFAAEDFPFYYVQIAPYDYGTATQSQYLREAQTATLSVKNTGMAVTMDIGNAKNIHPANKRDVGRRLALWALAKTYGRRMIYSGPIYRTFKVRNGSIELSFDHAENGLVLKEGIKGNSFQIAGPDRQFRDAVVNARGKTLTVSNIAIKHPVAVRYAFENTPAATLFNKAGLPAPSFRTDDWEDAATSKETRRAAP